MEIERRVCALKEEFQTDNPEDLARGLGISIYDRSDFSQLLGMFAVVDRRPCIFLNANMGERDRRIVLAHELGHAVLHQSEEGILDMVQFTLFSTTSRSEYEANVFAAHLLMDDGEVRDHLKEGVDVVSLAQTLQVDINLLLIKLHEMEKKGMGMDLPDLPPSDFLKYGHR